MVMLGIVGKAAVLQITIEKHQNPAI